MSERQPTLEDVARRAGVSRALVSLALRNSTRVAATTRQLIWEAAADLGYRPNLAARNLASRRTATIGVLLNDLHNPFFAQVYDGIAQAADEATHQLLLTTAQNRRAGEREAIESMREHRVDGMVLVGPRLPSSEIAELAKQLSITVVGRVVRDHSVDCVTNDDALGARMAVQHLHQLGHVNVAHIDGGNGAGAQARRIGFERSVAEFGMRADVIRGDFTEQAGADGARKLLRGKQLPTAIFGANDLVAVGALDVLEQAGHVVPDDVSVLGYDNTAVARIAHLSLTSVEQPAHDMGRIALEVLLGRIAGRTIQRVESVQPTLVIRRTTQAVRFKGCELPLQHRDLKP
jgi:DNA-binding LacI/PurR family transcriptional regulator